MPIERTRLLETGSLSQLIADLANERVARAQMLIERIPIRFGLAGLEPQDRLGEPNGERIPVHAVDAPFEHLQPDQVRNAQLLSARGSVFPTQRIHERTSKACGVDGFLGQLVQKIGQSPNKEFDRLDQEVATADRGVDDLDVEQLLDQCLRFS